MRAIGALGYVVRRRCGGQRVRDGRVRLDGRGDRGGRSDA